LFQQQPPHNLAAWIQRHYYPEPQAQASAALSAGKSPDLVIAQKAARLAQSSAALQAQPMVTPSHPSAGTLMLASLTPVLMVAIWPERLSAPDLAALLGQTLQGLAFSKKAQRSALFSAASQDMHFRMVAPIHVTAPAQSARMVLRLDIAVPSMSADPLVTARQPSCRLSRYRLLEHSTPAVLLRAQSCQLQLTVRAFSQRLFASARSTSPHASSISHAHLEQHNVLMEAA
jgi:hypothetical protein